MSTEDEIVKLFTHIEGLGKHLKSLEDRVAALEILSVDNRKEYEELIKKRAGEMPRKE
jgi:hypothetical protein